MIELYTPLEVIQKTVKIIETQRKVQKLQQKDFEHYLIKFNKVRDDGSSSDYTKLEYIYMDMAREIGIDVPKIELLTHGNLAHYLIKRFDRIDGQALHLHSVAGLTHTNFNLP